VKGRRGPERKLRLEQELLLTLMKLKLGLFTLGLGFRFHVSTIILILAYVQGTVSFDWPSQQQVKKTLPSCFRKLYPKDALLTALSASQKLQVDLIWQLLSGVNINITALSKSLLQSLQIEVFHVSSCYGDSDTVYSL